MALNLDCIAQVLREDVLTDGDLARASLISRSVAPLSRTQLYHTLHLRFLGGFHDDDGTLLRGIDWPAIEKARAVVESPILAAKVRRVDISYEPFPGKEAVGWHDPANIFDGVFEACHGVEAVSVSKGDWTGELADAIRRYRPPLRSIEGVKLSQGTWEMLAGQPALKHLAYTRGYRDPREQDVRPPPRTRLPFELEHLELVLELDCPFGEFDTDVLEPILESSAQSLRTLEVVLGTASTIEDFSRFKSLRVLHVAVARKTVGDPAEYAATADLVHVLRTIRSLPLELLALTNHRRGPNTLGFLLADPDFPSCLPPTLKRLDIEAVVRAEHVSTFLSARDCAARLSHFGHDNWNDDGPDPEVDRCLRERGI